MHGQKGEDRKFRSLKQHGKIKVGFSQLLIVSLLIIVILIAVLIAIPQTWKKLKGTSQGSQTFTSRLEETATAGKKFKESLGKLFGTINELKQISGEVVPEPIEIVVPEKDNEVKFGATKYINYDWDVSFNLPLQWSYTKNLGAFTSEEEALKVTRIQEFIIPEFWEQVESATTSLFFLEDNISNYTEERTNARHATVENDNYTYIFTSTTTDTFSVEQESIITSLQTL